MSDPLTLQGHAMTETTTTIQTFEMSLVMDDGTEISDRVKVEIQLTLCSEVEATPQGITYSDEKLVVAPLHNVELVAKKSGVVSPGVWGFFPDSRLHVIYTNSWGDGPFHLNAGDTLTLQVAQRTPPEQIDTLV